MAIALAMAAGTTSIAPPASADESVGWIVKCDFHHRLKADPIVFLRQPGASHLHDFFGNTSTNAFSTYRSLRRAGTNCTSPADRAAYWTPTLIAGGQARRPSEGKFYYRSITQPHRDVRAFPPGLKVVAGNGHATGLQPYDVVHWGCEMLEREDRSFRRPRDCGKGFVEAKIIFPDCWDGEHLDSADHKRHMAYSFENDRDRQVCPRTHPVPVPSLSYALEWPVHDGTKIRLSSGPHYTLHADFFNAWNPDRLRDLVRRCIRRGVDCGTLGE
jgi:hypothetical protein